MIRELIPNEDFRKLSNELKKTLQKNLIIKEEGRDKGNFIWIGYKDGLLADKDAFCHYEIRLYKENVYVEVHFEQPGTKRNCTRFVNLLLNKYLILEKIDWDHNALRIKDAIFELAEKEKILESLYVLENLLGQELREYSVENYVSRKGFEIDELLKKASELKQNQTEYKTIEVNVPVRNVYLPVIVKKLAKGKCMLYGEELNYEDSLGLPYLEVHHIKWISQGGLDDLSNMVALCPNCHKKMHISPNDDDIKKLKKKAAENMKKINNLNV